jgi:uncharacterized LabA/DUF88 family protein
VLRGILITAGIATEPGFIRAHYYTSLRGDDAGITATAEALRRLGFHPSVFKRTSDGRSKGVDITLARDFLSHAFLGNYDVALLMTSDGDFLPLVEEAQRHGRIVVVASFADGVSPHLRLGADAFVDFSRIFARSWQKVLGRGAFAKFLGQVWVAPDFTN